VIIDNNAVYGYNGIEVKPTQTLSFNSVPDIIVVSATVKVIIDRFSGKDIASDCAKLLVFDPVRQNNHPMYPLQLKKTMKISVILDSFLSDLQV